MRMKSIAAYSFALVLAAAILAGCNPGPTFTTELSITRGLREDDAVTHSGEKIGAVTDIKSLPDGKYEVGFRVDRDHAKDVRRDSFAQLMTNAGPPRLEIVTTDPNSPPALPNAKISGAATEAEAALLQGRGQLQGLAGGFADALKSLNA